jgi:hypothetical protein
MSAARDQVINPLFYSVKTHYRRDLVTLSNRTSGTKNHSS